jgi:hypothetical protein
MLDKTNMQELHDDEPLPEQPFVMPIDRAERMTLNAMKQVRDDVIAVCILLCEHSAQLGGDANHAAAMLRQLKSNLDKEISGRQ